MKRILSFIFILHMCVAFDLSASFKDVVLPFSISGSARKEAELLMKKVSEDYNDLQHLSRRLRYGIGLLAATLIAQNIYLQRKNIKLIGVHAYYTLKPYGKKCIEEVQKYADKTKKIVYKETPEVQEPSL